jgi:pimeloyl-ACP methyl ester carboxylesterase
MERYGWWAAPFVMQIPSELDSLENARKLKTPAVFILSGQDQTVLPRFQQEVVDAYGGEKHLVHMPEAGHNLEITGAAAEQLQHELDWIWSLSE